MHSIIVDLLNAIPNYLEYSNTNSPVITLNKIVNHNNGNRT